MIKKSVEHPPETIKVVDEVDHFTLILTWFSYGNLPVMLIIILFNFLFWFDRSGSNPLPLMIIFRLLGIGLLYWVLVMLLNRTEFQTDRQTLTVRHRPLPWPGNRSVALAEVDQLFVTRSVRRRRASRTLYSYRVNAYLKDGERRSLVTDLHDPAEALFVEKKLENFLGITDRPIEGEFSGEEENH